MNKEPLLGNSIEELEAIVEQHGLKRYVAKQIAYWLYKTAVTSFEEMTNVAKSTRELLDKHYTIGHSLPEKVSESADGTKKYLFKIAGGEFIEAAYIPDGKRHTLCVSSQAGCKMGCLFCMTGKQGFQAHLTCGEILNQVRSIAEFKSITNIVYMGMGEPFDNVDTVMKSTRLMTAEYGFAISTRKVTVSTIGIIPAMRRFLDESKCNLAVSMHSPFEEERRNLMPIQQVYNIHDVIALLQEYREDIGKHRRVSFEYILFSGINDTPRHVKELARILNGVKARINLIRFHTIPGSPLKGSADNVLQWFSRALNDKGITTTIRASRGQDIEAACGLLSTRELVKKQRAQEQQ